MLPIDFWLLSAPLAFKSSHVQSEWSAPPRKLCKVVTPILRKGDINLVPDDWKSLHYEDFTNDSKYQQSLHRLIHILE